MKDYNERNYYENRRYLRFFSEWQLNLGFSMANFKEIPIEHTKKYGFWLGLWETVLRVLFAPHHFFAKMQPNNSILGKLLFALFCINLDIVISTVLWAIRFMVYFNEASGVNYIFTLVNTIISLWPLSLNLNLLLITFFFIVCLYFKMLWAFFSKIKDKFSR